MRCLSRRAHTGHLRQIGAGAPGAHASRLFDLVDPMLDWVALAHGMGVAAERVQTPSAPTTCVPPR